MPLGDNALSRQLARDYRPLLYWSNPHFAIQISKSRHEERRHTAIICIENTAKSWFSKFCVIRAIFSGKKNWIYDL